MRFSTSVNLICLAILFSALLGGCDGAQGLNQSASSKKHLEAEAKKNEILKKKQLASRMRTIGRERHELVLRLDDAVEKVKTELAKAEQGVLLEADQQNEELVAFWKQIEVIHDRYSPEHVEVLVKNDLIKTFGLKTQPSDAWWREQWSILKSGKLVKRLLVETAKGRDRQILALSSSFREVLDTKIKNEKEEINKKYSEMIAKVRESSKE